MNQSKNIALAKIPVFLKILIPVLVFLILSRTPTDADLWWHLRAGQEMWHDKAILQIDRFSYTRAGQPWVNAFWLSELILYGLYQAGGYFAITTLVSMVGVATFSLIQHRLSGNAILNGAVILLAAFTAAPIWGPRPQIFSFLLLAWLDQWLTKGRGAKRHALWVLGPVFAFWANIHGGWIWGFLLLFAHLGGESLEHFWKTASDEHPAIPWKATGLLVFWSLAAALAIGLNPNGLAIWKLPFQQVNVSLDIQEWLSPDFHRTDFHPLLWMLFLLLITANFSAKPTTWSKLFKVTGFAYLTFVAQRNIALFAIVSVPLLADWGNAALQNLQAGQRFIPRPSLNPRTAAVINTLIIFLLATAALGRAYLLSHPNQVDRNYPAEAVEWIKVNHPEGRLFNSYNWGGYLTWTLPEYPLFIDGRADLYGEEIIDQWKQVVGASAEAQVILDQWDIQLILLEPGWPIGQVLQSNGWAVLYRDEKAIILGR